MIYNRADDAAHRLVDAYCQRMKDELDANFYKGDRDVWSEWSLAEAISEVEYHLEKLRNELDFSGDREKIAEYSADVGNCAMFVADIAGAITPALPRKPEPPKQPANVYEPGYSSWS